MNWAFVKKSLLLGAEFGLVVAILALLLLTWLPAVIGPNPGAVSGR